MNREETLQEATDRISFELISKYHPHLAEAIKIGLASGLSANQIEWGLRKRFGDSQATVLVAGAAHHLEQMAGEQ
jgi:hypothetical protein